MVVLPAPEVLAVVEDTVSVTVVTYIMDRYVNIHPLVHSTWCKAERRIGWQHTPSWKQFKTTDKK
jgi:hypothetical protein